MARLLIYDNADDMDMYDRVFYVYTFEGTR
jgi:hypothetical protein